MGAVQTPMLSDLGAFAAHLSGDQGPFLTFRTEAFARFSLDLAWGTSSLEQEDLPDPRHVAHSLQSVLALI